MASSGPADPKAFIRSAMGQVWAGSVARACRLAGPKALLRLPRGHVLGQQLSRAKWESIVSGGADPTVVTTPTGESAAVAIAALPGLAHTAAIPRHPLFGYGATREPYEAAYQLLNGESPIIQLTVQDWRHAEWLDLIHERDAEIHPLIVDWGEYRSLDGLFVLVRALEAAYRAGEADQAAHLASAWRAAAISFGASVGLQRKDCDAWQWFVEHILAGPWWPHEPSGQEVLDAQLDLAPERPTNWLAGAGREAVRRRNHDVALRAMARRSREPPYFMVVTSDARWRWLVMHRQRIAAQVDRASRAWRGDEPVGELPPLHMPRSIHDSRSSTDPLPVVHDYGLPEWAVGRPIKMLQLPSAKDAIEIRVVDDGHAPGAVATLDSLV